MIPPRPLVFNPASTTNRPSLSSSPLASNPSHTAALPHTPSSLQWAPVECSQNVDAAEFQRCQREKSLADTRHDSQAGNATQSPAVPSPAVPQSAIPRSSTLFGLLSFDNDDNYRSLSLRNTPSPPPNSPPFSHHFNSPNSPRLSSERAASPSTLPDAQASPDALEQLGGQQGSLSVPSSSLSRSTSDSDEPAMPATARPRMGAAEKELKGKSKTESINSALLDFFNTTEHPMIEKIADTHSVDIRRVQQLRGRIETIKKRKAPSAYNAAYQQKADELNHGVPKGRRATTKEIHQAIKDDEDLQEVLKDPVQAAELKADALARRNERICVSRNSNKARAQDAVMTLSRVTREVEDLASRAGPSGICAFGLITRGSFTSTVEGGFFVQGPMQEFLQQTFNIGIWDFVSMAENFACREAKIGDMGQGGKSLKKDLAEMITERLRDITRGKVQTMNYVHYGSQVVEKHKVHIVGWPDKIPIQNPYSLSMSDAREIHDRWKTNLCQWKVMTAAEHKVFVRKLNERREAGQDVDVQRQERSDKGHTHKRRRESDGEGSGGAKKRRKSGGKSKKKSREVVESDSEPDGEGGNGGDDGGEGSGSGGNSGSA
ncbi:hypothetical protein V5O48_011947 [Marasmius crinis-equi]|uniref:Uncharacterized protein n=1 Tax=Marasmius crinis-equi TaxID=585013 RepID=A0ABR3F449_9AGAR